ncbi:zinc finger protein OZF-like isoform X1 [Xiphophorus maculatus]|uniref:zinc finger protein OZF-like isoform X1 n=2 Tax=Xiphophorus maculatus TaxID=8083 RepID=UPI000293BC0C|nr:zinc finger protein OZF-like isoform X1 [Xiphophorus maculatus]
MEAGFNHKVLLDGLDVKQMLMVKEAPEDHRSAAELHDPKPQQIKEEQEEVCISLGAEQLKGEEDIDAIRCPVSATPIKTEDDKQSILLLRNLYKDEIKERDLPKEIDEEESIKIENCGDGSTFLKTEDTEDDDVNEFTSELDSGLKTENLHNDWQERRAPESDGNINKPFNSSEFPEQFVHSCSLQTDMTHSEMGSSTTVGNKCFTEKKNVDSKSKIQTGVKLSCEYCGKTFSGKYTLNTHERIHTGQKPFCCDLCGQRFNQKSTLNRHMRNHTGQKPFCCDFCEQKFSQKSHLIRHMRNHTGQKPFCCDFCGQRFSQKSHLSRHMRNHNGEKPFGCDLCGHKFGEKSNLNIHMRIHTGQKPFCCDICGQNFAAKSNLITHTRSHTGQKPFYCDVCGQKFSRKSHLNTHMRIHTGQKPFCCDLCGQRFNQKSNLNTHMRIHTKGKNV